MGERERDEESSFIGILFLQKRLLIKREREREEGKRKVGIDNVGNLHMQKQIR